jgi:hypothetical protein
MGCVDNIPSSEDAHVGERGVEHRVPVLLLEREEGVPAVIMTSLSAPPASSASFLFLAKSNSTTVIITSFLPLLPLLPLLLPFLLHNSARKEPGGHAHDDDVQTMYTINMDSAHNDYIILIFMMMMMMMMMMMIIIIIIFIIIIIIIFFIKLTSRP